MNLLFLDIQIKIRPMKLIIIFLINLLFNNYLINTLINRNEEIGYIGLSSIRDDFQNVGFPVEFQINSLFISFFVSILLTSLIYIFVVRNFKLDDILQISYVAFLKIPLIYIGTLTFSLYLLRVYNLSRGVLIVSILIYSIIGFIGVLITSDDIFPRFFNPSYYRFYVFALTIIFGVVAFFNVRSSDETSSISVENSEVLADIPELSEGQTLDDFGTCFPWSGSDNYDQCIEGASITVVKNFPDRLTNVISFESEIYVLQNDGIAYVVNDQSRVFLDITDKVGAFEEFFESGFFSLAFHPSKDYLVVGYSDKENHLVFEEYQLTEAGEVDYENSKILLSIPNSQCCHYSGNVIWSDFFQDFIVSVGDMETNGYSEKVNVPLLNSEPIDTTSPRGKVLLLNKNISKPKMLSVSNLYNPREDIIGYGLRNPWKTYEYKNYLFIPDIGFSTQEELNIVDLNEFDQTKEPFLFGWPHYEGMIDNNVIFNEIFLYEENIPKNPNQFIEENTIFPNVYYEHSAPANFRAALIGGGVISDTESEYFENYFFADYISTELFSYDFQNDKLSIIPLPPVDGYITSIETNPNEKNSLFFTTGSGYLFKVILP